jgi:hypothetical protein
VIAGDVTRRNTGNADNPPDTSVFVRIIFKNFGDFSSRCDPPQLGPGGQRPPLRPGRATRGGAEQARPLRQRFNAAAAS